MAKMRSSQAQPKYLNSPLYFLKQRKVLLIDSIIQIQQTQLISFDPFQTFASHKVDNVLKLLVKVYDQKK